MNGLCFPSILAFVSDIKRSDRTTLLIGSTIRQILLAACYGGSGISVQFVYLSLPVQYRNADRIDVCVFADQVVILFAFFGISARCAHEISNTSTAEM